MKKLVIALALIICPVTLFAGEPESKPTSRPAAKPWSPRADCSGSYGAGLSKGKVAEVTLAELVKNPKKYEGKAIRVKGSVKDVCSKKGCWLMLSDGKNAIRVRFKDYKFFVPTNAKGYEVVVEGLAKEGTISEKMAKHYAEESGDKEAAKKIKGPQKAVSFTATGVQLSKKKG